MSYGQRLGRREDHLTSPPDPCTQVPRAIYWVRETVSSPGATPSVPVTDHPQVPVVRVLSPSSTECVVSLEVTGGFPVSQFRMHSGRWVVVVGVNVTRRVSVTCKNKCF